MKCSKAIIAPIAFVFLNCFAGVFSTAVAAHFDGRYVTRIGDLNADGRLDIYVTHSPRVIMIDLDDLTIPIVKERAQVKDFVLQQTATGSFVVIENLTPSQLSAAALWSKVAIERALGDYNADGQQDMMLKNLASVIPGVSDQLIFAPALSGNTLLGVRAVDAAYRQFLRDLSGRLADPAYFRSGWYLYAIHYVDVVLPTWNCGQLQWADTSGLVSNPDVVLGPAAPPPPSSPPDPSCVYAGTSAWYGIRVDEWRFDSSQFSSAAIAFLNTTMPYVSGQTSMPLNVAQSALQQLEQLLGVQFGDGGGGLNINFDPFGAGAIGGYDSRVVPVPGGIPTVLPPVFIPTTSENREWGQLFYEVLRRMAQTLVNLEQVKTKRHDCLAATEPNIRAVLANSPLITEQQAVSASEIEIKVEIIKYNGVGALPPVKIDGFVLCDGHHRFIAARLCGTEMPKQDWTANMSTPKYPIYTLRVDP